MRIHSSHHADVETIDQRIPRLGEHHPDAANDALTATGEDSGRIGALLVARGIVTAEQADQIARAQRGSQQRFGETAVALGFAPQDAVDAALASQFNFSVAAPGASRLHASLITARGQRDRASELIRSLRTNLSHVLADWPEGPTPAVTIASVTGTVGRRLIASNLAIASAQAGVRTLLVDADLRKPALHMLFGTPDGAGLSTFLAGRQAAPPIQSIAAIPGLAFLPAGPTPPNPAELLARLDTLLPVLRAASRAELLLFNVPPLDAAEDLYVIAAAAPAVVMITRRHFTRARALTAAAARLRLAGATIIGSVLNVA